MEKGRKKRGVTIKGKRSKGNRSGLGWTKDSEFEVLEVLGQSSSVGLEDVLAQCKQDAIHASGIMEDSDLEKELEKEPETEQTQELEVVEQSNDDGEHNDEELEKEGEENVDEVADSLVIEEMSSWSSLPLHFKLVRGLYKLGFTHPTKIQEKALPIALESRRRNIMVSAETGSGKTLVFALPILSHFFSKIDKDSAGVNVGSNGIELAVIISPTRELAMQIVVHFEEVLPGRRSGIDVIPLVGGISLEKQLRFLEKGRSKYRIIVATPGRFWMIHNEHYHVDFAQVRFLVIDEADRMLEEGHFKELGHIIENVRVLNEDKNQKKIMDTPLKTERKRSKPSKTDIRVFLLSATLNFDFGKLFTRKRKTRALTVEGLFSHMNFVEEAAVVVADAETVVASGVREWRVDCGGNGKDEILFNILHRRSDRILVFVNSIGKADYVSNLLSLLGLPAIGMHSRLHQRQRLKNIERFEQSSSSILVATDVVGRGIDIADITLVVHYNIARTVEGYVHRCGRTARGEGSGESIMLVDLAEKALYRKICEGLGRQKFELYQVDETMLHGIRKRVEIAREIFTLESRYRSKRKEERLYKQIMEAADLEIEDSGGNSDEDGANTNRDELSRIKDLKTELTRLLDLPLNARDPYGDKNSKKSKRKRRRI